MIQSLTTYDIANLGNDFYFFCNEVNALVKCDSKNSIELIDRIPEENIYKKFLISQIMIARNKLICVPMHSTKIWIYDIVGKNWMGLPIDNPECETKFLRAFQHENYIYMFPCKYGRIVKLDIESMSIKYIDIGNVKKDEVYFRFDMARLEDIVIAACCYNDCLFKFDLQTESFEWENTNLGVHGLSGIAWDGEQYWITPKADNRCVYVGDGSKPYKKLNIISSGTGTIRGVSVVDMVAQISKADETILIDINSPESDQSKDQPYVFMREDESGKQKLSFSGHYYYENKLSYILNLEIDNNVLRKFVSDKFTKQDVEELLDVGIMRENDENELERYINCIKVL